MTARRLTSSQQGFTIVELMIALSVLSTILVMSTIVLIQIGSLYTKGVNGANLQNTTRTIMADVAASLQFSGNQPPSCTSLDGITCYATVPGSPRTVGAGPTAMTVYSYCIDTTRYSYVLNRELGDDTTAPGGDAQTAHVLWRDTMKDSNDVCKPLDLTADIPSDAQSAGGYEMMSNHMRLTRFNIPPPSGNVYTIDVWTAFGDSDLVNTQPSSDPTPGLSTCNGGAGTQFCATSMITTSITRRVVQ